MGAFLAVRQRQEKTPAPVSIAAPGAGLEQLRQVRAGFIEPLLVVSENVT